MSLRIDLQTHTNRSPVCGWMSPKALVRGAERAGLDGVAVTDHDTMAGVDAARKAASQNLLVIPGEEVDTPEGQIIGLFLSDPIEPWQPPGAVIDRIHEQDGLALAPHPFDPMREGLESIAAHAADLDAVETLNARCLRDRYNERAREFAETHRLPATGGSDAHFQREVGAAYTRVDLPDATTKEDGKPGGRGPGVSPASVKDRIRSGDVAPEGRTSPVWVHAGTKTVKLLNRVSGW